MKRLTILLGVLFLWSASSYAFAAPNMACEYPFYDKGVNHGISYLSGGVGKEERSCLVGMEKGYNLMMIFALSSRPYLANETVRIQDHQGTEVFQGKSDGPWLMVRLPVGDYRVTVSREGHETEVRQVKVSNAMHVEEFVWKS